MRAGTSKHAELEAETAGTIVKVPVETREDAFAIRLLNMDTGLQQLLSFGLTRELPICGTLQVRHHVQPKALQIVQWTPALQYLSR